MNHIYTIELRFFGEELNPEEITKVIKIEPSSWDDGLEMIAGKRRKPFWGYNGHDSLGFQNQWEEIEVGLKFLFEILSTKIEQIHYISHQYEPLWWCSHFQKSFDGGPTFSVETLQNLSTFEIPLFLDCYFQDTDN